MKYYEYGVFVKTSDGHEAWLRTESSIPAAEATVNIERYRDELNLGYCRTYVIRPRPVYVTYGDWEEPV